jgi:hypothetical protein
VSETAPETSTTVERSARVWLSAVTETGESEEGPAGFSLEPPQPARIAAEKRRMSR